jgi:uncharacterized protein
MIQLKKIALIAALSTLIAPQLEVRSAPPAIQASAGWRQTIYAHAREKLNHSAWGWRHSERDYLLAREIGRTEPVKFDDDVLFAAAFLHDAGAIPPFALEDVDHAVRSVQLAESLLRQAGFPMAKFPQVRAAILGHMYDEEPTGREAVLLHDADTLDFLGATGVARQLSGTPSTGNMDARLERLRGFILELPPRLKTRSARRMSRERIEIMRQFLHRLDQETPQGTKL